MARSFMPPGFRTRRSAGVPVTAAVHRVLQIGNAARDRRDWPAAAAAFQEALGADPGLAHIWIQLGNMLKETGDTAAALDAYAEAAHRRPGDPEPLLQSAHLHDRTGRHGEAGAFFLRAFEADPGRADAAHGLHHALAHARGPARDRLLGALTASVAVAGQAEPPTALPHDGSPVLAIDVSDLVRYWGHNRLPTGIQRVQIQLITHALRRTDSPDRAGVPIAVVCFIDGRDEWLELGPELFGRTVALSLAGGSRDDPAWIAAMHHLHAQLTLGSGFTFPRGAFLLNLGSSWALHNYFLFVRDAKRRFGIRYVPLIYDLIPALAPEYFTESARRNFLPWVPAVLTHADRVLTISEASKRDLLRTADALGTPLAPDRVLMMPLDADSRPATAPLPDAALDGWRLSPGGFVLLVSTVEPRKGHMAVLEAWSLLIARHGATVVPKLVCVGSRGWMNEPVYARLERDKVLAGRVTMLEGVGDAELALLYRTCLFTVYPSLYEGWGLPVTEAFCHGKAVVTTDTSSLPEAGGEFAVYVPPADAPALAEAVGRLAFDAAWRAEVETRIRTRFHPRSWGDLAVQLETGLVAMAADGVPPVLPVPVARLGCFHSLARPAMLRLWPGAGAGEAFRTGTGWAAPDSAGSRVRPGGGTLAIAIPSDTPSGISSGILSDTLSTRGPLYFALLLLGPKRGEARWRVTVEQGPTLRGRLAEGARRWVTLTCPAVDNVRLRLRAELADMAEENEDAAPGMGGFFVCRVRDADARMRLLEAVALGNLDELDAYGERDDPVEDEDDDFG